MARFSFQQRGGRTANCLLALIFTLSAAAFAGAQQQQQEKEPTLAEAKAAFAKADRALNQAWGAAKAAVTGDASTQLTQGQREWLQFRDYQAGWESEQAGQKDPKRSAIWHSIAADLTTSRAEWLRGRARKVEAEETLTGLWSDSYGGTLSVVQQEGRLFFMCEVVRGPTYHTGSIAGVASWNQKIGWFSDKGRDPDKPDETNIAFTDREGCLELVGANTMHYHGARAHFDGIYCKVGTLPADEQAKVLKAAESGEADGPESGGG